VVNYIGFFNLALDEKKRFFLPKPWKQEKRFVLTLGLDNCLLVYPDKKWAEVLEKLKALSWTKETHRKFLRLFLSRAKEVEGDNQGRILIPPDLAELARIKKRIVFLGLIDRSEIWAEELFRKYEAQAKTAFTKLAEQLEINI